jgi:four helix bundle protein
VSLNGFGLSVPLPVPVPLPGGRNEALEAADVGGIQALDHERLDVYRLALDFLVFANSVIDGLPCGRSHLADPFTRASMFVVLTIAEGAGKVSKGDKRRYYLTARGSATESAALLEASSRSALRSAAPVSAG